MNYLAKPFSFGSLGFLILTVLTDVALGCSSAPIEPITLEAIGSDPTIAVDIQCGIYYATWIRASQDSQIKQVMFARSDDGRNFTAPWVISEENNIVSTTVTPPSGAWSRW